ncbi:MAG: hypothetical protein HC913_04140 [Microscillaceae bacterium]|nr:hypothetical protein [Microscillaceae bacterium]
MQKKIVLLSLLVYSLSLSDVFGQLRLGLSPVYGLPTGDFGAINKNGYGASASAKFALSRRFALTGQLSFLAFGRAGDDLGDLATIFGLSPNTINLLELVGLQVEIPRTNFYPLTLGFEYYILRKKIRPYVGLSVGLYMTDTETIILDLRPLDQLVNLPPGVELGVIELNASDANFGLAPSLGCAYHFSDLFSLDLNITAHGIYVPDEKAAATVLTFGLGAFFNLREKQSSAPTIEQKP